MSSGVVREASCLPSRAPRGRASSHRVVFSSCPSSSADNVVLYGRYEKGHHKGEGARWSADRREAQLVVDGVPRKTIGLARAKEIVTNLGFDDDLPPPA